MTSPDERTFTTDVGKAAFRMGEREERWGLVRVYWPFALISVTARDTREFYFRFDAEGYPESPPTACLWDPDRDEKLAFDKWPVGQGGRLSAVFRTGWKNGTALYLPCDRLAFAGHENWRTDTPSKIWRPAEGIVQYLELVHELLNCRDYKPVAGAAA